MRVVMYCFLNHGWAPSKYLKLPLRERIIIACIAEYEIEHRPKYK